MCICIDSNIPLLPKVLKNYGEIYTFNGRELTNGFLKEKKCTALFIRSTVKVHEHLLKDSAVKFIATATAGTDHVDEDFLKRAGIIFKSAGGSNANAVAEYVIFAGLLWADLLKTSLKTQTIGIIGYGNIGKRVAFYAQKIGLKVLVNDPPLNALKTEFPKYVEYCELPELLQNSDIITNHVPLVQTGDFVTENLLKESELELLQENALVVHASRGGIIEQSSLQEVLIKGKTFAAIDVWENEPDIRFKNSEKLMLATPHIAGHTWNAKLNGTKMVAEAFKKWSGIEKEDDFLQSTTYAENPDFHNQKALLKLLGEKRKLTEDSEVFKKILHKNTNIAVQFDELRRNYPQRFEILSSEFDNF